MVGPQIGQPPYKRCDQQHVDGVGSICRSCNTASNEMATRTENNVLLLPALAYEQSFHERKSHCSSLPRDTGLSSLPSEHASVSQFGWSCCLSRSFHLLWFLPSFQLGWLPKPPGGAVFSGMGRNSNRARWLGTVPLPRERGNLMISTSIPV
jgi:hypothetical protein